MPFKITIKLLNGEELEYFARPHRGRAKYLTHIGRIEQLVRSHLGVTFNEYDIRVIFSNEEELLTEIYKEQHSYINTYEKSGINRYQITLNEEKVKEEVTAIMENGHSNYHRKMYQQYYFTENTEIYALAEKREVTIEEQMARWKARWEQERREG